MANEEQLSILKQGVEVWNKWRDMNHRHHVDLSRLSNSLCADHPGRGKSLCDDG